MRQSMQRTERIHLRYRKHEMRLLERAAKICECRPHEFVRDSALEDARDLIAKMKALKAEKQDAAS